MYFSDIYSDRELPEDIKNHKELWGIYSVISKCLLQNAFKVQYCKSCFSLQVKVWLVLNSGNRLQIYRKKLGFLVLTYLQVEALFLATINLQNSLVG